MTEARFIERGGPAWQAMEHSLRENASDFQSIEARMALYRTVSGHYSYAKAHFGDSSLCTYLGQLTAQAHAAVYAHTKKRSFIRFFTKTLPDTLRGNMRFILIAAALFLLAALIAYTIGVTRPAYVAAFLPDGYKQLAELPADASPGSHSDWKPATMSNSIMINNIRVSVLAFGLGLTLGIGTAYILVFNGFMLGGLASVFAIRGQSLLFWSLILPHGVWELTAIFIAGGAGLRIGYSLLRPGVYRRRDSLLHAGRASLNLMAAITILLIVAGIIEGFFTPSSIEPVTKLVFAGVTAVPLVLYLFVGREARPVPPTGESV